MVKRPPARSSTRSAREAKKNATALAVTALSFIAAEPERLGRFLALSGIGPESIRDAARDPDFLIGVLDHLCEDETLLVGFAEQNGIDPDDVMRARVALAGPGWERETP